MQSHVNELYQNGSPLIAVSSIIHPGSLQGKDSTAEQYYRKAVEAPYTH